MGTANIVFGSAGGPTLAIPAYNGVPFASEDVTTSGTSAQSAAAEFNCLAYISADVAVYVKVGTNPTAAAGDDWLVPAGYPMALFINRGDKIAVIDA